MSGTTSIDDLPINMSSSSGAPVQLQVQERNDNQGVNSEMAMRRMEEERKQIDMNVSTNIQNNVTMSQEDIKLLNSGLQSANQSGSLSLPSRDIPMTDSQVKMDQEARVNYVPVAKENDYIGNTQTTDEIITYSNKMKSREETMESIYEELQTPVLIGILFFIFMIPSVRRFMFKSFPMLLQTDGNPTFGGYVYIASLFGLMYYILNKLLHHFSQV